MNLSSIAKMLGHLKSGLVTSRQIVDIALERSQRCMEELNAFSVLSDRARFFAIDYRGIRSPKHTDNDGG